MKSPYIEISLHPLHPVIVLQAAQIQEVFGADYKYDFPKWCKKEGLRCFYKAETRTYVVFPMELEEQ